MNELREIFEYFPDGKVHCHYFLNDSDHRVGLSLVYHQNGTVLHETTYGEETGEGLWRYPSGGLRMRHCARGEHPFGESCMYEKNGKRREHVFVEDDGDETPVEHYIKDIKRVTTAELLNLTLRFGDNFWTGKPKAAKQ